MKREHLNELFLELVGALGNVYSHESDDTYSVSPCSKHKTKIRASKMGENRLVLNGMQRCYCISKYQPEFAERRYGKSHHLK